MIENDIILGNNSSVISQSSDFIRDKNYARDIMLKENCEERVNEEISSNPNIKFDAKLQLLIIQKKNIKNTNPSGTIKFYKIFNTKPINYSFIIFSP